MCARVFFFLPLRNVVKCISGFFYGNVEFEFYVFLGLTKTTAAKNATVDPLAGIRLVTLAIPAGTAL